MASRKLYRPSWAAYAALIIHIVWIVIAVYLLWVGPSGRMVSIAGVEGWVPPCPACDRVADSVRMASELGRLELVSVALTILGVVLAIVAFGSFFVVRAASMAAAREEAAERLASELPGLMTVDMIAKALEDNPQIVLSAVREARRTAGDVDAETADQIARSLDDQDPPA